MKVNDKDFSLTALENGTILELVKYFNLKPNMVAVERNGQIEDRNRWQETRLQDTDCIELIKFIGGG